MGDLHTGDVIALECQVIRWEPGANKEDKASNKWAQWFMRLNLQNVIRLWQPEDIIEIDESDDETTVGRAETPESFEGF